MIAASTQFIYTVREVDDNTLERKVIKLVESKEREHPLELYIDIWIEKGSWQGKNCHNAHRHTETA